MDDHVKRILIAQGHLGSNGRGRAVQADLCRRCGRHTLSAWDDDVMAGWAVCDAAPLSPFGEVLAKLGGKNTYELKWCGTRYELFRRDYYQIAAHPPGDRPNVDVLVAHTCGVDIAHTMTPRAFRKTHREPLPENPPF